jgi:hypothetical protein
MKKVSYVLALVFSFSFLAPYSDKGLAQATPVSCFNAPSGTEEKASAESIRLFYIRDSQIIAPMLTNMLANCSDKPTISSSMNEVQQIHNDIVIFGTPEQRAGVKRIIAILDLPRERVNLAMWGILVSSRNPKKLNLAMREINQEITQTQRLLVEAYAELESYSKNIEIDPDYESVFEDKLSYKGIFSDPHRSLSMTDILIRLNGAKNPEQNYNSTYKNICRIFQNSKYKRYIEALNHKSKVYRPPFENFFRVILGTEANLPNDPQCQTDIELADNKLSGAKRKILLRRRAILEFALQYANRVNNPNSFDPQSLQLSADNLNSELNLVVDAINRDVEELFIQPTLTRIQDIVRKHNGVEYAEVGRSTVAGLHGLKAIVTANTRGAFEETKPLRLNELLTDANNQRSPIESLAPNARTARVPIGPGSIPISSLISLLSAAGANRTIWRELGSGINLDITPSVLRNNASAELKINFIVGIDPENQGSSLTSDSKARPLSRISSSSVNTTVYVKTLDLFVLSTFNNETTIDGGRSYFPVVGTIWRGIFGDFPGLGNLFSWPNSPKTIQHQSIILTNTFITPTAMGLAPRYSPKAEARLNYELQEKSVKDYLCGLHREYSQRYPNDIKIPNECSSPSFPKR